MLRKVRTWFSASSSLSKAEKRGAKGRRQLAPCPVHSHSAAYKLLYSVLAGKGAQATVCLLSIIKGCFPRQSPLSLIALTYLSMCPGTSPALGTLACDSFQWSQWKHLWTEDSQAECRHCSLYPFLPYHVLQPVGPNKYFLQGIWLPDHNWTVHTEGPDVFAGAVVLTLKSSKTEWEKRTGLVSWIHRFIDS